MGGKYTGSGKHLYVFTAYLIILLHSGCAPILQDISEWTEAWQSLLRSRQYHAQGDYPAAIKENQRVLSLTPDSSPGDEALFNLGLIYAHTENPGRDYEKSLAFFKKMLQDFPQSSLLKQASTWVVVLEEKERFNKELDEVGRIIAKSKEENKRLKERIKELTRTIEQSKREKERLNKKIEGLNHMIEKSKQVDIEIEQKKREEAR